jgi:large subunit ribosomal protein L4
MAELVVKNLTGEQVDTITVSDEVFGAKLNVPLMHQAVVRLQAGRRLGTQKAKTRGEVTGGGEKPWRQKGTGRARQGSRTSPLWRGGGVAHPPTPRSFAVRMPKKMRRQATRSALSARVSDEAIVVVSTLQPEQPKTKAMVQALGAVLGESAPRTGGRILLVDGAISQETSRAARNIPGVDMKPASTLNIVDVLDHDVLIFSVDGIRQIERLLSHGDV